MWLHARSLSPNNSWSSPCFVTTCPLAVKFHLQDPRRFDHQKHALVCTIRFRLVHTRSMESPYSPGAGVPPPVMVGRDRVYGRAVELLARTESFGHPGRSPLIITGVRGVGKTVLLGAVQSHAASLGFLTAAVVVDRQGPLPTRIAAAIGEAMRPLQPNSTSSRWHRWLEWLRRLSVEVSVPGVKIGTPRDSAATARDRTADRDLVVSLLRESAELARAERPGLLLALDELHEGPDGDLSVVTGLAQELVGSPLIVIGAGLPQTPDRLMAAGSFAERFQYQRLGFLDPSDAATALLAPASSQHVNWDQDAADHVLNAAAGAPYLLQLYGDNSWRAAEPGLGSRIRLEHAQTGVSTAREELQSGLFRGRWNRASGLEQQYLRAMASQLGPDGSANTGTIAGALGRDITNLSSVRRRLIDKGLIQPTGHGRVEFSIPGFEIFIAAETDGP